MDRSKLILRTFKGFALDDHEIIDWLINNSKLKIFEKGAHLIKDGYIAKDFYIIQSGILSIRAPFKQPKLSLFQVSAHDILGWSSLFAPYKYIANVFVEENSTLLHFDSEQLIKKMQDTPKLGHFIMKEVSNFLSQRLMATIFELYTESSSNLSTSQWLNK